MTGVGAVSALAQLQAAVDALTESDLTGLDDSHLLAFAREFEAQRN